MDPVVLSPMIVVPEVMPLPLISSPNTNDPEPTAVTVRVRPVLTWVNTLDVPMVAALLTRYVPGTVRVPVQVVVPVVVEFVS